MKKLFEYKVVFHPKVTKDALGNEIPEKDEHGKELRDEIIAEGRAFADNEKQVEMLAARATDRGKYPDDKLDRVEILVRPFP